MLDWSNRCSSRHGNCPPRLTQITRSPEIRTADGAYTTTSESFEKSYAGKYPPVAKVRLEPGALFAHNNLGVLYDRKGLYDEAIAAFEKSLRIDPANATVRQNLENARRNKVIVQEREAQIAEARKQVGVRPKDPRAAHHLARVYASYDEKEQALHWLARAVELGFNDFGFLKADPALAGLRSDPRFTQLLEGR